MVAPVTPSKAELNRHGSIGVLASVVEQLIQRQHQGPRVGLNHQFIPPFQTLQLETQCQLPRGFIPALKQRHQEVVATTDHIRIHLQACEQREMAIERAAQWLGVFQFDGDANQTHCFSKHLQSPGTAVDCRHCQELAADGA